MRLIFAASFLTTSYAGAAMAIEGPKFIIEKKSAHYEIRKYEPTLVAETLVKTKFDQAGNQAFHILADYIFGNNKSKTKIEMTAPVTQTEVSGGYLIQFTMLDKLTLATVPVPNDPRVQIRQIAVRRMAVYRYSGLWSEERYKEKLAEFISLLQKDGLEPIGEPVFARFNSPFMIWFLRRNEIWFEVHS